MKLLQIFIFFISYYFVFRVSLPHFSLYALLMMLHPLLPIIYLFRLPIGFIHEVIAKHSLIQVLARPPERLPECGIVFLGRFWRRLLLVEYDVLYLVGMVLLILFIEYFILRRVLHIKDIYSVLVHLRIRFSRAASNYTWLALKLRLQSTLGLLEAFSSEPIKTA